MYIIVDLGLRALPTPRNVDRRLCPADVGLYKLRPLRRAPHG